jgi:restriction system protein
MAFAQHSPAVDLDCYLVTLSTAKHRRKLVHSSATMSKKGETPIGHVNDSAGNMRDLITEEVGCKAGLLLTDNEARTLLARSEHSELWLFEQPEDELIRIRPEEVDDIILSLRHQMGNLPDEEPAFTRPLAFVNDLAQKGVDATSLIDGLNQVVRSGKYKTIGIEAADEIKRISGMDDLTVAGFLTSIAEYQDRSVSWFNAEQNDLTWAIPLQDLFQSESIPSDPDAYLDQRYIDFLASNSEDIERMHWRNFERLTAEFFSRKDYVVELGPGGNDGGIDVRVWPKNTGKSGPPLLVIQCKRYEGTNEVEIQTVKAFWTDVLYEDAHRGLVATTSRIAPGGIKTSRARRWPLGFAENKQVHHWVQTMWRHSPLKT